jgi:hypothetical protein
MIKKKINKGIIEVDLTGPQGNAFYLMGLASELSKKMGLDKDEIIAEMMSGDYENLIKVFDRNFGNLVILYR